MCMPLSCYYQQTEALVLSLLMRPGWCGVIVGQDWRVSGNLPTPPLDKLPCFAVSVGTVLSVCVCA